jgi:hypothetical protein
MSNQLCLHYHPLQYMKPLMLYTIQSSETKYYVSYFYQVVGHLKQMKEYQVSNTIFPSCFGTSVVLAVCFGALAVILAVCFRALAVVLFLLTKSPLNWSKHQVCEAKKFKCNIYIQTQDTSSMCRCFVRWVITLPLFAVVLTICFIGERAPNNPEFY